MAISIVEGKKIDRIATATENMAQFLGAIADGRGSLKVQSWSGLRELVRLNMHTRIPVRDQFEAERESNLTASKGDSTGISAVSVDIPKFLNAVGEAHEGIYEATFDGAVWHKENGENIILSDYGLSVTGTPVKGDHIIVTETTKKIILDVMDHNKLVSTGKKSIVLGAHDVFTYGTIPLSAPQLLYYTENGMAAGNYCFRLNHGAYGGSTGQDLVSGHYYGFTLSQAITAKGGFKHSAIGAYQSSYNTSQILNGKITTYGPAPDRTVIESNISVIEITDTTGYTDLGTFTARDAQYSTDTTAHNFTERNAYGTNRYKHFAARQYLNSDAPSDWWTAQNVFDMPPVGRNLPGFLYGLDPALVKVLGRAEIVTAMPDPDRTAGEATSEILYDKVFLFSMTELGWGNNISIAEGSKLAYYDGATNADRIKREGSTARYWWLRGPYPGSANHVRIVNTGGSLDNLVAYNAYGLVPGLVITDEPDNPALA